jgi:hypothetical protein
MTRRSDYPRILSLHPHDLKSCTESAWVTTTSTEAIFRNCSRKDGLAVLRQLCSAIRTEMSREDPVECMTHNSLARES